MILDDPVRETILPAWDVITLSALSLGYLRWRYVNKRKPAPQWKVQVASGENLVDKGYDYHQYINMNEAIHIRLRRGNEVLNLGQVSATDNNVEDQIDELVAKAEERAASLNARM